MGAFADQIEAFKGKALDRYQKVIRFMVTEAGERLVARSPIGAPETWKRKPPPGYVPGNFVSNWNYSLMTPDRAVTARTDIRAVNYIDELPAEADGLTHYITNSVPYGPALEHGHSNQAPQGMVGLTREEFPQIVRLAIERVKQ